MKVNEVSDPILEAVNNIRENPKKAYERMKADQEKLQTAIKLLEEHQGRDYLGLFYDHEDLFWGTREILGLRVCKLRNCNGEGIIGNGFGDEYFCECMTKEEQDAYNKKAEGENI
ncbi:MAG: hypothetical protein ACTSSP_11500 [Candidatus Asgardarchaeia archaeon]